MATCSGPNRTASTEKINATRALACAVVNKRSLFPTRTERSLNILDVLATAKFEQLVKAPGLVKRGNFWPVRKKNWATLSGHSGLIDVNVVVVVVVVVMSMLLLTFSVIIDNAVVVFLLLCISFNSELDAVIQL